MKNYLYKDLYELEDKHWWHISKRRIVSEIIDKYKKGNLSILDIGCGTGRNIENLKAFGKVNGIDSSKTALSFCKKRGIKNVSFGKAEKIPYKSRSFEIITLLDVLEHTDDEKTVAGCKRVLKPKGILIITVPAYTWLWSNWDEVLHHRRRYTSKKLHILLTKHEFNILKMSYMYSFLIVPAFITRRIKSFFAKDYYISDFKISFSFLNYILEKMAFIEFLIIKKINLPFGTSIIIEAQKNG